MFGWVFVSRQLHIYYLFIVVSQASLDWPVYWHNLNISSHCPQKMYSDFELQGVIDDKLNSKIYQNVASRMHTEEATCSLLLAQQDAG
jgi:calcium-dependent secretion activator